ncbi:MAG: PilZ domain-containing protein [Phycisphaerales bacterium]
MAESSNRRHEVSAERRSQIRIRQVELQSSLGPVLDITSAGIRVMCRRIPKDEVKFDLNTTVDPLSVRAEVVWAKRLGFRKHEVGLHFTQTSPELDNLIRCCCTLDGKSFWNPPSPIKAPR